MNTKEAMELFWFDEDTGLGFCDEIWAEMRRAAAKHNWDQTPLNEVMRPCEKLVILVEEVGEVARAITYDEGNTDQLRKELVQVATMAAAWAMSIKK